MEMLKNAFKGSLPVVVGVLIVGVLLNYGGNLPVLKQAKDGLTK